MYPLHDVYLLPAATYTLPMMHIDCAMYPPYDGQKRVEADGYPSRDVC